MKIPMMKKNPIMKNNPMMMKITITNRFEKRKESENRQVMILTDNK